MPVWGDYFFKTDDPNKVPKKFKGDPTRQLDDGGLRCIECGWTIAEHTALERQTNSHPDTATSAIQPFDENHLKSLKTKKFSADIRDDLKELTGSWAIL